MTPTITQEAAYSAMRSFLLAALPTGVEVVQGQVNRVPMAKGPDWIVMQAMRRDQMATSVRDYHPPVAPAPAIGSTDVARSTTLEFQLDIYGPNSADNAQVVTNLFRDLWGVEQFKASGLAPLTCTEPGQLPLLAGEQQWIQRWTITATLHGNIAVSVPTQFADTLITGLTEITHGI